MLASSFDMAACAEGAVPGGARSHRKSTSRGAERAMLFRWGSCTCYAIPCVLSRPIGIGFLCVSNLQQYKLACVAVYGKRLAVWWLVRCVHAPYRPLVG